MMIKVQVHVEHGDGSRFTATITEVNAETGARVYQKVLDGGYYNLSEFLIARYGEIADVVPFGGAISENNRAPRVWYYDNMTRDVMSVSALLDEKDINQ